MKEKLEGFPKPYLEVKEGDPGLLGDSNSTFFSTQLKIRIGFCFLITVILNFFGSWREIERLWREALRVVGWAFILEIGSSLLFRIIDGIYPISNTVLF